MDIKSYTILFLVLLTGCSSMALYQQPKTGSTASLSFQSDAQRDFVPVSVSTWDCSKYADEESDIIGRDLRKDEVFTVKIAAKKPFPFVVVGNLPSYTCAVRGYFIPEDGVDYQLVYHHVYGKCSVEISQMHGPLMEILKPDLRTGMCK